MEGFYRGFHPYPRHWVPPPAPQRQTPRYSCHPHSPRQLPPQSVSRARRDSSEEYIPNLPQPLYPTFRHPYPNHQDYAPQGYTPQPPPFGITGFGNAQHVYHHPHHEAYGGRSGPLAGGRMAVYHHPPPQLHYQTQQYPQAHGGGVPTMRGNTFGVPPQPPPPHGFGYGHQPAFAEIPQAMGEANQGTFYERQFHNDHDHHFKNLFFT